MARQLKILSICCGAGLWDSVWLDRGHDVVMGCEVSATKRRMYEAYTGASPSSWITHDIRNLAWEVRGMEFDGIIAGIPCQSRSSLANMVEPKFGDLLSDLTRVINAVRYRWLLLENVKPLDTSGIVAHTLRCIEMNAMHYDLKYPQNRPRFFMHTENIRPIDPLRIGSVDDLVAYPCVAGRLYGPTRMAILQGHREFADLDFPSHQLQEALADGVHRGTAQAWLPACEGVSA